MTEVHRLPTAGAELEVSFKRPAGENNSRLPTILLFGGFQTGARALELVDPAHPVNLITFEYPFDAPRKLQFPGGLKLLPEAKRAIHHTVEGIEAVIAWASRREDVDKEKIVLAGASFGAPFAAVGAERSAVRGLVLVHGFGDIPGTIAFRLGEKWKPKFGRAGEWAAIAMGKLAWAYANAPDPETSLRALSGGQTVLMLTAENDDLLPPSASESLRKALQESKAKWSEEILPGAHLRPGQADMVQALLNQSVSWMRREGIL